MKSSSNLHATLEKVTQRSAQAMVARAKTAHSGLNQVLARHLAAPAGHPDSVLADPVYEIAKAWKPSARNLGEMEGGLLSDKMVNALANADDDYRMGRDLHPYLHQEAAWEASLTSGKSVLVTAGTGSGKTESFMIPILQDIVSRPPRPGGGVQAILLYPLNALIESQRDRLSAWSRELEAQGCRVRFAMFNGNTAETERKADEKSDSVELRSRKMIRDNPPEILVTNITMLEYMLLRGQDRSILEKSQGALRWIVLDEAHSYIGSQAAEMALLLRRVRSAFGVSPQDVRLMATSATIGGEKDAVGKLQAFASAMSGRPVDEVAVVEGVSTDPILPKPGADRPFDLTDLKAKAENGAYGALWKDLEDHPRILGLRHALKTKGMTLTEVSKTLFDKVDQKEASQTVLDAVALAETNGEKLLPWRAHLFHRAQGGIWACVNPGCTHRDAELADPEADWPFGAVHMTPKPRCECGFPVYEIVSCKECGTVHLQGQMISGARVRLEPPEQGESDDYLLDLEPDEVDDEGYETGAAWLVPGKSSWIDKDGWILDNEPKESKQAYPFRLIDEAAKRGCCDGAKRHGLMGFRFGPAFFLSNAAPLLLEDLTDPKSAKDLEELGESESVPAGGRRAITFSDSRQGVARLAAKLQQEAERTLTRSYLWHRVSEGVEPDPAQIAALEAAIAAFGDKPVLQGMKAEKESELAALQGGSRPVPWPELVSGFRDQKDLRDFVGDIWKPRWVNKFFEEDIGNLAAMLLFRELLRRPRVQNNPETLGLVRLVYPELEKRAMDMRLPAPITEAGIDAEGWKGLALAAVDFGFRQNLAVNIEDWMVGSVAPKSGRLRVMIPTDTEGERPKYAVVWPDARSERARLTKMVYALIGGTRGNPVHEDRADEVLKALWTLITKTVGIDIGGNEWRLDFNKVAVERLERAWLCPITRRPFGYHVAGKSPYDPMPAMPEITFPKLPIARGGGLDPSERRSVRIWCHDSAEIANLRTNGLWTPIHDRLAEYPRYIRAQEHSAQINRPVLARYEEDFGKGKINLLNCSTTMEMGVDIPAVQLVINANVPPALSNYRQRVGRAGRRREPWAFAMTFCRDLPLDTLAFRQPLAFLERQIVAPKVWFDSAALVQRHINAALLSRWFADQGGVKITESIGSFMGVNTALDKDDPEEAFVTDPVVDKFLDDLRGDWGSDVSQIDVLTPILFGTCLESRSEAALISGAADTLGGIVRHWRDEYRTLFEGMIGTDDQEIAAAYRLRAKRLAGEFLLGELSRRGFTPSYGFPTDVVSFTSTLAKPRDSDSRPSYQRQGGASRELHLALREYTPGNEVVIDGQVFESEGILPAWQAGADASNLEDIRDFWSCPHCFAFGLASSRPSVCPQCDHEKLDVRKIMRPAGFLSSKPAHTGYEMLTRSSVEDINLSAQGGEWVALPQEAAGRIRVDPLGQQATLAPGPRGGGFAVCFDCGRAMAMNRPEHGLRAKVPDALRRHYPLFRRSDVKLTRDGYCPGSDSNTRILQSVNFAQVTRTDVWEWQLPAETKAAIAQALAAAMRDALAERLGVEAAEIGLDHAASLGPADDERLSIYLFDRASGGAGLSARMIEPETFTAALTRAAQLLDCPDGCRHGCPTCILRPDINKKDEPMDRPGALELATKLLPYISLPEALRILGPETQFAGKTAMSLIERDLRDQRIDALEIWVHGEPDDWDLPGWALSRMLPRLHSEGVEVRMYFDKSLLSKATFDLGCKLALHRFAAFANIHFADRIPEAQGRPIIAVSQRGEGSTAFVTASGAEASPGSSWGQGSEAPLLFGPAPQRPNSTRLSMQRIMEIGVGNASLLWPGRQLDGPLTGFGKRFWQFLAKHAPLEANAFQTVGVKTVCYSDRYLMTPQVLAMAATVMKTMLGAKDAKIRFQLSRADQVPYDPRMVWDNFPSDRDRTDVLETLLPGVDIELKSKNSLPHHRALSGELNDGRTFLILLDQGFGAWRAKGSGRHDFQLAPAQQAKSLVTAFLDIESHTEQGAPIALSLNF